MQCSCCKCCKTKKTSPISFWKLKLNDPELHKKYTEQDKLVCVDRAKPYLVYLLCLLPISTALIASHAITFSFYAGEVFATILLVAGCLFASRFRPVAIDCILPLGVVVRAAVKIAV